MKQSFIEQINHIAAECLEDYQGKMPEEQTVRVYIKPYGVEDPKQFEKAGTFVFKKGEDAINAAKMWLYANKHRHHVSGVDVGYDDPLDLDGKQDYDSMFVFVDGAGGVEGFNFIFPGGTMDVNAEPNDDSDEVKPFMVQRDKPNTPD